MNPRILKKREEKQTLTEKLEDFRIKAEAEEIRLHEKNENRIAAMENRITALNAELTELENTDIIGLVRAQKLTVEELAALLNTQRPKAITPTKEEAEYEE